MTNEYYGEFYPTPNNLIYKMFEGIKWHTLRGKSILEPSAGKGDIVEKIKFWIQQDDTYNKNPDIDAIEINPELQSVLRGKGIRVVSDDFLKYRTFKHYQLIVMNPPFSNGWKHLRKALDMQQRGGDIICILNANTIKKPDTIDKALLLSDLQKYDAQIEYLGNEFTKAYRSTDVEIALIKVSIPPIENEPSIIIENLRKARMEDEADKKQPNEMTESDFVKQIVSQYEFEANAGVQLIREYKSVAPYISTSFDSKNPILELKVSGYENQRAEVSENNYLKNLRSKYWTQLFNSKQFSNKFTSNLLKKISEEVRSMQDYDFSEYNINHLRVQMMNSVTDMAEKTILDLFDELSHKHHWYDEMSNNVHYYNGWKTNKSYIVNQKVILPWNIRDTYDSNRLCRYSYGVEKLLDLEKTLQYLDGKQSDSTEISQIIETILKTGQTANIECKYFRFTTYKKGTLHVTFTDTDLLKKFNLFGSQKRGWLPPTYGRAAYSDMTAEEKAVIDEYEGEAEYNKVLENPEYYLSGVNDRLLTSGN